MSEQKKYIYTQNYGLSVKQNSMKRPSQFDNKKNQSINQQQITDFRISSGNKTKSFTQTQYLQGQVDSQSSSNRSGKKNIAVNLPENQTIKTFPPKAYSHEIQYKPALLQNFINPEKNKQNFQKSINANLVKTATLMTVNTLSNLPLTEYLKAEYSSKPFYNISGYAFNSYNGKDNKYNEDRTKTIINYPKKLIVKGTTISPHISYFGIFDGHGGEGCSNFLTDKLDSFLFNSKFFPAEPIKAIKEAFFISENTFMNQAIDRNKKTLVDKSGSCACIILIVNDILYAINLGDSRALLSSDNGQHLRQITRDHKPNDPIEKRRIEKSGAKVIYEDDTVYRIIPGGIAVSFIL